MTTRTPNPLKVAAVNSTQAEKLPTVNNLPETQPAPGPTPMPSIHPKAPRIRGVIRTWWITRIGWPISKAIGFLLCMLNFHVWEDASAIDAHGEPITNKPGLYKRCARPACRIYRDRPLLKVVANPENGEPLYYEVTDEFEVIARVSCMACQGRGSSRSMILPSEPEQKVTARIPCQCLRIQPRYIRREPAKGGKR